MARYRNGKWVFEHGRYYRPRAGRPRKIVIAVTIGSGLEVVRKILHSKGVRYGLFDDDMIGRPHIVMRSRKSVIFVPDCREYSVKCGGLRVLNRERDLRNVINALERYGWRTGVLLHCLCGEDYRERLSEWTKEVASQLDDIIARGSPKRAEELS